MENGGEVVLQRQTDGDLGSQLLMPSPLPFISVEGIWIQENCKFLSDGYLKHVCQYSAEWKCQELTSRSSPQPKRSEWGLINLTASPAHGWHRCLLLRPQWGKPGCPHWELLTNALCTGCPSFSPTQGFSGSPPKYTTCSYILVSSFAAGRTQPQVGWLLRGTGCWTKIMDTPMKN